MIPKRINDFRNGRGYIYATRVDGTSILEAWRNTPSGGRKALIDALTQAPVIGTRMPVATITVSAVVAANVTSITILGVNQLGGNVAIDGADSVSVAATKIASAINSFAPASGFDYIAKAFGGSVDIFPPEGITNPASLNGQTATVAVSNGGLVISHGTFAGGATEEGIYDSAYGRRYFLNADYDATAATPTALGSAIEISSYIIKRGTEVKNIVENNTIANDAIKPTRRTANMILNVDTEASASTDDLKFISSEGFAQDDTIVIQGVSSGRKVTLRHSTGSGENIYLANGSFETGVKNKNITLKLSGTDWHEVTRSVQDVPSVANLRKQGIAQGVEGVAALSLTNTGGTILLMPGSSKRYQLISGSDLTPTASWSIAIDPVGTYMEGDCIEVDIRQKMTFSGSNGLNIFGVTIPKDATIFGGIKATATKGASAWHVVIQYDPTIHSSTLIPNNFITMIKLNDAVVASFGGEADTGIITVTQEDTNDPVVEVHSTSWPDITVNSTGSAGIYNLSFSGANFNVGLLWLPSQTVVNANNKVTLVTLEQISSTDIQMTCRDIKSAMLDNIELDASVSLIIKHYK